MKRYLIFISILLSFQSTFSQSNEKAITDRKMRDLKDPKREILFIQKSNTLHKTGLPCLDYEWIKTYDSSGGVVKNEKTAFNYNNHYLLKSETIKTWDEGTSPGLGTQIDYERDNQNYIKTIWNYEWSDSLKRWKIDFYEDISYIRELNVAVNQSIVYKEFLGNFFIVSKIEYGYDKNEKLISDTYYKFDTTNKVHIPIDQITYTYDSKGRKITDCYLKWNVNTQKYDSVDKYTFSFDSKGNTDTMIYNTFSPIFNQWLKESRDVYSYDDFNNLLTDTYSEFDTIESKWKNVFLTQNTYDSKNNRILSLLQELKFDKWVNLHQIQNLYDMNFSYRIFLPFDEETQKLFFKTKFLKSFEYSWNSNTISWDTSVVKIYHYGFVGNVKSIENSNSFTVFPNPAVASVTLHSTLNTGKLNVDLFSIKGQLVLSKQTFIGEKITLPILSSGIYTIQISDENGIIANKKLIID